MKKVESNQNLASYCKPNSLLPSNPDLNELNQSYAHFDTVDFSDEIIDEKATLNVNKNVDECLVISENETRQKFLNVNANKAKKP